MSCVNCDSDTQAYTLRAHVENSNSDVDLQFCSSDCLDDWV
ncbi:MAG: hypothetical protein ACI8XM_000159 [Haloarculaceae archaeon]|jgi:hypothetical protein